MAASQKPPRLSSEQRDSLLQVLKSRFLLNIVRHATSNWAAVEARLAKNPAKLWSLHEMERTGGEPDVVSHPHQPEEYWFFDCSPETPKGRTSLCYDRDALNSRKEHRPKNSAVDLAAAMGVDLLTEAHYRSLQSLGEFDQKTSSWIATPPAIRKLGGALFGDRRYGRVFFYHNGAQSYFASRGFRAALHI